MLSFSKALSFLMAFAVTSSITTTTVQGRLLAGHDSADSSDIVTCGQCLPIMEGDEAVIGVRLYKASSAEEYLALADEIASPFFSTQPGFISYTGVQTQDPEIVMFMSIYDTVENSAAAYEKMKETIQIPLPSERLMNYYGTITWTGDDPGGDEDCVKSFDVGDYLSARMHYRPKNQSIPNTRRQARYKIFSAVESFDSYTTSKGLGEYDTDSFFFEIFNDKDDSAAANALQVSGTALDPKVSLIYNVVAGQVVFDSTCSDDYPVAGDDEFATEQPTSEESSEESSGESSGESSEEPTSEESSEESSECESVADTICASDDHQVLCGLFQKYDTMFATWLSSSERGNDWIVFAPNDDAFSSSKTMQKLLEDTLDDADVQDVLEFHVASVEDNTTISAALSCGAKMNMANGDDSRTKCKNGNMYQTGTGNLPGNHDDADDRSLIGPQITNPDDPIEACNGKIYVLDGVMLPKLPRSA